MIETQNKDIDILSRDKVIDELQYIILGMSKSKTGAIFALDGKWGYGKSFVLSKIEDVLSLEQNSAINDNRYNVFHYNCWQYDYYEEPTIAIVSSMLDKIRKDTKIINTLNNETKKGIKIVKKIAGHVIENKIGINLVDVYEDISNVNSANIKEKYEFDKLYSFKETLDKIRQQIQKMAKEQTVVFVVDELDRCIPSYAIRVLERLHHIFDGLNNVIVLLAIDSTQLEGAVREIFGDNCDVDRYLRKFISFKYNLDIGKVRDGIFIKYKEYFDYFNITDVDKIFVQQLLSNCGIDIRTQVKMFEKITIIHKLAYGSDDADIAVLLFELTWMILVYKLKEYRDNNNSSLDYDSVPWLYLFNLDDSINNDNEYAKKIEDAFSKDLMNLLYDWYPKNSERVANDEYDEPRNKFKIEKEEYCKYMWYYLDQCFSDGKSFEIEDAYKVEQKLIKCKHMVDLGNHIL